MVKRQLCETEGVDDILDIKLFYIHNFIKNAYGPFNNEVVGS